MKWLLAISSDMRKKQEAEDVWQNRHRTGMVNYRRRSGALRVINSFVPVQLSEKTRLPRRVGRGVELCSLTKAKSMDACRLFVLDQSHFECRCHIFIFVSGVETKLLQVLVRLPDIVVGGLRFYRDSIFFFRQLPSALAERNSTKPATSGK